jgi:hypothetical protein
MIYVSEVAGLHPVLAQLQSRSSRGELENPTWKDLRTSPPNYLTQ